MMTLVRSALIDHFWYGAFIDSLWFSPHQNRLAGHTRV